MSQFTPKAIRHPADTWRPNRCGVCGAPAIPDRWVCESCGSSNPKTAPAHRKHFLSLDRAGRMAAMRTMSEAGSSDFAISAATGYSIEAVREVLNGEAS